jgi:aryl-alcohol dehydrogenase-like predicted oxidoreductase
MEYRPLGRSGLMVSELGYGAWGIGGAGWVGADEEESLRALRRAIELGFTFIDTARGYGDSERIVGRVVREHPGQGVLVATKVPPMNGTFPAPPGIDPMDVFPGSWIRQNVHTSLAESGLDALDVLQLHVWRDEWIGHGDWLERIETLKRDGTIRAFGVSVNDLQPESVLELVGSGLVDTVQVIYNVFHQQPAERLLPACAEHSVGVIVRVALDEGGLTGRIRSDTEFAHGDWRASYFGGDRRRQIDEHVTALAADLGIPREELPGYALRFVLDAPQVSTVIAGMRSMRNVEANAAISDGVALTDRQRAVLARHRWERNFYAPA